MFSINPLPRHPSCEKEGHPIAAPFVASTNSMVVEGLVTSGQCVECSGFHPGSLTLCGGVGWRGLLVLLVSCETQAP